MFYKIYQIVPASASLAEIAGHFPAKVVLPQPLCRNHVKIALNPPVGQPVELFPERTKIQPPAAQAAKKNVFFQKSKSIPMTGSRPRLRRAANDRHGEK